MFFMIDLKMKESVRRKHCWILNLWDPFVKHMKQILSEEEVAPAFPLEAKNVRAFFYFLANDMFYKYNSIEVSDLFLVSLFVHSLIVSFREWFGQL